MNKKIEASDLENIIAVLRELNNKEYQTIIKAADILRTLKQDDINHALDIIAEINDFDKSEYRRMKRVTKQYRKADYMMSRAMDSQSKEDAIANSMAQADFVEA